MTKVWDWLKSLRGVSALIGVAFVMGELFHIGPFHALEWKLYDAAVTMAGRNSVAARQVVLVEYDRAALEDMSSAAGGLRGQLADLLRRIGNDGATAIGLLAPLQDRQSLPAWYESLRAGLNSSGLSSRDPVLWKNVNQVLAAARWQLDVDSRLNATLRDHGQVFLPYTFQKNGLEDPTTPGMPAYASHWQLHLDSNAPQSPLVKTSSWLHFADNDYQPAEPLLPLAVFGEQAAALGYLNVLPDSDAVVRSQPLALAYRDAWYPAFSVILAAKMLKIPVAEISLRPGQGLSLAGRMIKTDGDMRLYPAFFKTSADRPVFVHYSFQDLLAHPLSGRLADKLVLIGPARELDPPLFSTPVGQQPTRLELQASLIQSLLNDDYYQHPDWTAQIKWFGLLVVIALGMSLPALPLVPAIVLTAATSLLIIGLEFYLLTHAKLWVELVAPGLLLLIYALLTALFERFEIRRVVETHLLPHRGPLEIGADYQRQGQFDRALLWYKEAGDELPAIEASYQLALELERVNQYGLALEVYDHILNKKPDYQDVKARRRSVSQLFKNQTIRVNMNALRVAVPTVETQEPVKPVEQASLAMPSASLSAAAIAMLGTASNLSAAVATKTSLTEGDRLGRYTVESTLGRGAMGMVYKAMDSRINRMVALKTMALREEFEADEIIEVRERFFHEAEVAGRLSHPHIVTIYDVGEQDDLAYIAMEYVAGKDLRHFVRKQSLLPIHKFMELMAQIAEALDYAHKQGVIHRDIKPSNIILDDSERSIKVVDFGIARIGSTSRTRTGTILGTPLYMSPEQLAGRLMDGRSDIFSLGILMFELLTGERPFEADSVAALMMKITRDPQPDVLKIRGGVPICLRNIVDKCLQKDPAQRFQTAAALKIALLRCINNNYTGTNGRQSEHDKVIY